MKIHQYYVYILTNSRNKVLYTGVTNNLVRRYHEHKKLVIEQSKLEQSASEAKELDEKQL